MNTEDLRAEMKARYARLAELRRQCSDLRWSIEDAEEDHRLAIAAYNASMRRDARDAPSVDNRDANEGVLL
jgi:hypothetical protein